MKREKTVLSVSLFGIAVNLVLFFAKLYVSLSVNSISIFSDAVNNLSDSLSCVLSAFCMICAVRFAEKGIAYLVPKIEQILSFVLAIVVSVIAFSFAYSSLERLMYPSPVWFSVGYFFIIAATAAVKLGMFFVNRHFARKTGSPVIKVMATDSITDFAVTSVTLITFTMTKFTRYTVDAFAGLVISAVIIVEAVRLIKENLGSVLNFVKKEKRDAFLEAAREIAGDAVTDVFFAVDSAEEIRGYVSLKCENEELFMKTEGELSKTCFEKTGIRTYVVISKDDKNNNEENERNFHHE